MKKFVLFLYFLSTNLMLMNVVLACPGAGLITIVKNGEVIAAVDEYNAVLTISQGYNLAALNTKLINEVEGNDFLDDNGAWKWLCDERDGIDNKFRNERPYCHDMQKNEKGDYLLPVGVRDFHIFIGVGNETHVFKVKGANIDPNQPRARGGCGKTVGE